MYWAGMELNSETEEAFAYELQYLTNQFYNQINKIQMSLFFYTREVDGKIYTDSFNLNKVIRSMQMDDNKVILVLDDLHERSEAST